MRVSSITSILFEIYANDCTYRFYLLQIGLSFDVNRTAIAIKWNRYFY
jgi:hypothetical protein